MVFRSSRSQDALAAGLRGVDGSCRSPAIRRAAGPLPIIASRLGCLLDALSHAYDMFGFTAARAGDEVFFQLVAARIIEPVSKLDSLRVLAEAGWHRRPTRP